jgi:hypothetical protein
MASYSLGSLDRSTINLPPEQRRSLINDLYRSGYNASGSALSGMTNDELLASSNQVNSDNYQARRRQQDRQDALIDFRAQLGDLTASKQRQAEQAGRLAQANTRTQGLSQMMSNF